MEKSNTLDLELYDNDTLAGHASCLYYDGIVQIRDLFIQKAYLGRGLDEKLLLQIHEYAHEKNAKKIVVYCGPEPFSDNCMPVEEEVKWYEQQGYVLDHRLYGIVPCMIKRI